MIHYYFISSSFLLLNTKVTTVFATSAFGCHCPFLAKDECKTCSATCAWDDIRFACLSPSDNIYNHVKWYGFLEFGQTHVIKATGETRHAPKTIAERETELLFTPTEEAPPTLPPTPAPTTTIEHQWGLEELGTLEVTLADPDDTWANGYPSDKSKLLVDGTEYYIHEDNPNVNIDFDLESERIIQGVYLKTWYYTRINDIKIGIHHDDGASEEKESENVMRPPSENSGGWEWFEVDPVTGGYNNERIAVIPKKSARYVKIKLLNGSGGTKWGLRRVKISGIEDGLSPLYDKTNMVDHDKYATSGLGYIPLEDAIVRLAAYSSSGNLLGIINLRNPSNQRPLLEQSLTTTILDPYSTSIWSGTLPWNWILEDTQLLVGTNNPETNELLQYKITLENLAMWSFHRLTRAKVIIFGSSLDVSKLDTHTHNADKLAKGMFNSMPVSQLNWVDDEDWHLPYIVVDTQLGPKKVESEQQRREVMIEAGEEPGNEPPWVFLKNQLTFKHRLAHTGRGLSETTSACCGSTPYASGTSIFMGWALSKTEDDGTWVWDKLGYWEAWAAAGWTGWTSMRPGDECGNTLIHEVGHSQTFAHFTEGTASSWGIADEYPQDGVNLGSHPWGYDTTSRRFKTWYKYNDVSAGKRDPMNGGEGSNKETCFPQYTAYHEKKSQRWALDSPVLLPKGMGANVDADGAYYYSSESRQYEKINQDNISSVVGDGFFLPLKVGVPVFTIIGTLGDSEDVCQMYPPLRSSEGDTFHLPSKSDSNLSSKFNDAAHIVEIHFQDGSVEEGLIAVPRFSGSKELRFFSFTIEIARRPSKVELFRFNSDSYPTLTTASEKTLLFTRSIESSSAVDPYKDAGSILPVGRGYIGDPKVMNVNQFCTEAENCFEKSPSISFRGMEDSQLNYQVTKTTPTGELWSSKGTIIEVEVSKMEDGTQHSLYVVAYRYVDDGSGASSYPLLSPSSKVLSPEGTYGIAVFAPYELNHELEDGTYKAVSNDAVRIESKSTTDESVFDVFYAAINVQLMAAKLADLSNGITFTSSQKFPITDSSAYFVVTNGQVGPTTRVWWGGSRATLQIPIVSECAPHKQFIATVKAQQQACGSTWQMNAGRGANSCEHALVLTLDNYDADTRQNEWMNEFPGCQFTTHRAHPVVFSAMGWHKEKKLGSLVLQIFVLTQGSQKPSFSPSENLGWQPSTSPSTTPSLESSMLPSKAPSLEPSTLPTKSPSLVPSVLPSTVTQLLSNAPTIYFSTNPTINEWNPPISYTPSSEPSIDSAVIVLVIPCSMLMDGLTLPDNDAELDSLVTVLEISLLSGFDNDGSLILIILSIGGLLLSDRTKTTLPFISKQLKGLEVKFEVVKKVSCGNKKGKDCESTLDSATSVAGSITDQLQTSLTDGSFASSLAENAADFGVPALENVIVDSDSFASEPVAVEISSTAPTPSPNSSGNSWLALLEAFISFLQALLEFFSRVSIFS